MSLKCSIIKNHEISPPVRSECPPACKLQVCFMTVMTHIIALNRGQSSQGSLEPITPVIKYQQHYMHVIFSYHMCIGSPRSRTLKADILMLQTSCHREITVALIWSIEGTKSIHNNTIPISTCCDIAYISPRDMQMQNIKFLFSIGACCWWLEPHIPLIDRQSTWLSHCG